MTHTLTVTRLGDLGDGLADGIVVPAALPRETVEGTLVDGRLSSPRILSPSPERVKAPCAHAGGCGGCAVQHASDNLVSDWKRDRVVEALWAHGVEAEVGEPITSPPGSRRRAGFAGRRTKKGAIVGFHGRASHTLIPVPNCLVVTEKLRAVLPILEVMTLAGGSRKGEIAFQVTETDTGLDVAAKGGKALDLGLHQQLVDLGARIGLARLTWNGETVAQWAPPTVSFGQAKVLLPPGAFLQATREGETALVDFVKSALSGASRVADLFCGCGTFALPLAASAEVLAVEGERAQTEALAQAARHTQRLRAVTAETRDLFKRPLLAEELSKFDGVVIDPPRWGAAAQVAELAKSKVPRIASVSCNPTTFARDAASLIASGYGMGSVTVVDQFRWSPHVELAALFTRA
ncbi:MAG: class I SAM-dependent RNA methyltransferase [Pseudomonadota bacterium]